jgi:hypothetical protein
MPKLNQGRLAGTNGMNTFTAEELHQWADELELKAIQENCEDDPRYILRWAEKIRKLAVAKEKNLEGKK